MGAVNGGMELSVCMVAVHASRLIARHSRLEYRFGGRVTVCKKSGVWNEALFFTALECYNLMINFKDSR